MLPIKAVILSDSEQINTLVERFSLKWKDNIFEWIRDNWDEQEKIVLLNKTHKNLEYLFDNYILDKCVYISISELWGDSDIKIWDVILPNTFLTANKSPIFLEYAIWNNYDLNKFGLLLNGVCYTSENNSIENNEWIDVIDAQAYTFLELLSSKKLLDKTVVIQWVVSENDTQWLQNSLDVLDLIL